MLHTACGSYELLRLRGKRLSWCIDSRRIYTDRGVTAWTVRDSLTFEAQGWIDICWPTDGGPASGLIFVLRDPVDGTKARGWRIEFDDIRFAETNPQDTACESDEGM